MDSSVLRECLKRGRYSLHDEDEILRARSDSRARLQWLRNMSDGSKGNDSERGKAKTSTLWICYGRDPFLTWCRAMQCILNNLQFWESENQQKPLPVQDHMFHNPCASAAKGIGSRWAWGGRDLCLERHIGKGAALLWPGGTIWFVGSGIQLHHFHLLIRDHSFGSWKRSGDLRLGGYQSFENICIHIWYVIYIYE